MAIVLSIIVPVYNVKPYLRRCVDSLLSQDLPPEDYEIILVDDGSPDDCPEICDEYADKNDNVRVIHRDNGGLSAARNTGISTARGEFVQFVDSDDYLEPGVLKSLVTKMDINNLDILRFNYQNVNENNEVFEPNKAPKAFVDFREDICDGLTFLTERLGFACYACQFVIRRDLLKECHFKEGVFFEDTEWTPRLLLKANRVASTSLVVYNYLMRQGSITQSIDKNKKLKVLEDRMGLIDSLNKQQLSVEDTRWFDGMKSQTALAIISDVCYSFFDNRKYYITELNRKGIFPLSTYHASRTAIRKIRMANLSPMLLCLFLRLKKGTR